MVLRSGLGRSLPSRIAAVAFFLSGAAALIYEAVWARYLGLFLGHSAYAQAIVLVTLLGGMAGGAAAAGRRSDSRRRPWLWYAAIELIVGLLGVAFHPLYSAVTGFAYERILPALPGGFAIALIRWLIAALLILPPSLLLGATFPLLAVGGMRREPERPGRTLAVLYFVNGLGGAVGVLAGGFVLVASFGLPGALIAAAALNLAAGVLVGGAELASPDAATPLPAAAAPRALTPVASPGAVPRRVLLAVAFGTGLASLIYEIAWTRMLSLVLGSATHSFELMLSAFLVGLSLGALWVRNRADRFADPLRALAAIQVVMGALAVATLPLYLASFHWMPSLFAALDLTTQGYALFNIARYGICLLVMLPATFCAGMTLPLITNILVRAEDGEAGVGRVYAVNTVGSILGVALGALILMPLVGLKVVLFAGAALDMALGVWLFTAAAPARQTRRVLAVAAAASALWLGATAWFARFDREVLTSGVYGSRVLPPPGAWHVLYYRDGVTTTVSALTRAGGLISLATNGKPDASLDQTWLSPPVGPTVRNKPLSADGATQALLSLITLAHAPAARTAAVVGHGSGMTAHMLLGDPRLESVTTIEIEPAMILGSNAFYPTNARVFDDPRSHFVIDDARAFLAAGRRRYDLIVSEPSNPWVSGVSSLFTAEFYRDVSDHLTDDGVFGQWLHLYEMNDDLLLTVLAALHSRFPSYALYYTSRMDLVVVASRRPALPAADWTVLELPAIAQDLRRFIPLTRETLEALRFGERATFAPLLDQGIQPNSDYYPVLDLGAERTRYLATAAQGFLGLGEARFDAFAALAGRRTPLPREARTAIPEVAPPRIAALAGRLRGARDRGPDQQLRDAEFSAALLRQRLLDLFLAAGAPPPDWQGWVRSVALVERDVHGNAQGTADERFYAPLERYLDRVRPAPPITARAAIDFLHGLAAWDWPVVARAADRLRPDAALGEDWLPAEMFRDGAVIAKLKVGDVQGARHLFDGIIGPRRGFRAQLLDAHIRVAEDTSARR